MNPRSTEARALLLGNWADPTIVRDGRDYYMTHSSFKTRSGLLLWHSTDLKVWAPLTRVPVPDYGSVWAPELVKHEGLFYLYYPIVHEGSRIWVSTAREAGGPWSEPVETGAVRIDPGHTVDEEGNRYLHVSGGAAYRLDPDGLHVCGGMEHVYDGWAFPDEWAVECFCLESPKITPKDGWYYLVSAQGGTFGPSTSHMVVAARSRHPMGPWENSPHNPVVHTWDRSEGWWSKGHGTLVEAPDGTWLCVFHGIRNGNRPLGRCTLAEPIEWTDDGWFRVADRWPDGWEDLPVSRGEVGLCRDGSIGLDWASVGDEPCAAPFVDDGERVTIVARGDDPGKAAQLVAAPPAESYAVEASLTVDDGCTAGILLYDTSERYLGLALTSDGVVTRVQAGCRRYPRTEEPNVGGRSARIRIVNDRQDVRFYADSGDGFRICRPSMEISDWGSTCCALFATGRGTARFASTAVVTLASES